MQSFHRVPLTAEWPLPGGTPFRDALLRDPDLHPTQHGSTEGHLPDAEHPELNTSMRVESSTTICGVPICELRALIRS